jgi:hypothetical protein
MIAAVIGAVLAYIYPLHGDYLEAIQSQAQELNAQFDE